KAIKAAKPRPKSYKLGDEKGLYLEVTPSGGRLWRLKYRLDGKEKRLALGAYPEVSLAEARDGRDDARKLLAKGHDPGAAKKAAKAARADARANSFEALAREWHTLKSPEWSDGNARKL